MKKTIKELAKTHEVHSHSKESDPCRYIRIQVPAFNGPKAAWYLKKDHPEWYIELNALTPGGGCLITCFLDGVTENMPPVLHSRNHVQQADPPPTEEEQLLLNKIDSMIPVPDLNKIQDKLLNKTMPGKDYSCVELVDMLREESDVVVGMAIKELLGKKELRITPNYRFQRTGPIAQQ